MLQAPTLILAAIKEAVPVTKSSQASPAASKLATDVGQRDPVDFPRPPGLVRTSFSEDKGKHNDTEIANYHSNAGFDETVALYLERVPAAGWKKLSDSVSGSGASRLRMIEWQKPAKAVEIRFYTNKTGGSDLRVRIFTYKTTPATNQAKSGPGAPAKDTPVVKAAPAAQANAVKTDGSAEKFGAAPVGPPPTNFQVQSYNPYSHNLSWSCDAGATCDLYRVDSTGRTQVAAKIQVRGMLDHAYLEPNTVYRVVVHYRDGREGSLDYTYANPPQPGVVTNLKAEQTGPGKVKLTWNREKPLVNNSGVAETYQVSSPTSAVFNQRIGTNSLEVVSVPVGNHWVRVAMVYGDSSKMAPAPKDVAVNLDVLADRARYRITILGLECLQETKDDPLQLDGKRDEVFLGVYLATAPRLNGNQRPTPVATLRTKVMGDTNSYPDRIRAGTASAQGGIQTGDFVPDSTITTPKVNVQGTTDHFPLKVWEGELTDTSDLLVIAPCLFEWDSKDEAAWNRWVEWWSTPNGSVQLGDSARQSKPEYLGAHLTTTWKTEAYVDLDGYRFSKYYAPSFNDKANRPINVEDQAIGLTTPDYFWIPMGMVLTHQKLEKQLGAQNSIIIPWNFGDGKYGQSPVDNDSELYGAYRLYFQIERLGTPPPPVAPTGGGAAPAAPKPDLPTANPAMVSNAKQAEMSKSLGAAPVGPPPTNLRVYSTGAVTHNVDWMADNWTSFDVYRIDSTGRTQIAANLNRNSVKDHAFLELHTTYRVDVHHTDGSVGSAEFDYAKPPVPETPTGFLATQTGDGKVKLSWVIIQYIPGFQLYGPTLPPEGKFISSGYTTEITGLPLGTHEFRLAVVYSGDGVLYPAPTQAKSSVTVKRVADRYRVTLLGLKCGHETTDDLLQLDGKRDEVFAGAYVASVPRENINNPRPTPLGIIRTKVMGDTNGFPDRVQAGTASDKGGIQSGDYVPDTSVATAKPGVTGTTDRFPLALWEGELSDTGDIIVVAPVVFEWDKQEEAPWNSWTGWWSSPRGSADLGNLAHTTPSDGRWEIVLSSQWSRPINAYDSYNVNYGPGFSESGGNRPVGVEDQANIRGSGNLVPNPVYVPRGLCLTHARVEAALGAQSTSVIEWVARDDPHLGNDKLDGTYILYIQIERLAPPP